MSRFLSPLPLLVVGCMVLQALTVSAEEGYEQVAPQEQNTSHLAREYTLWEFLSRIFCCRRSSRLCSAQKRKADEQMVQYDRKTKHAKYIRPKPMRVTGSVLKEATQLNQQNAVHYYASKLKFSLIAIQLLLGPLLQDNVIAVSDRYFRLDRRDGVSKVEQSSNEAYSEAYNKYELEQGHQLALASAVGFIAQKNTNVRTNRFPHYKLHNHGVWKQVENRERERAISLGKTPLISVTGLVPGEMSLSDGTNVPKEIFKCLSWFSEGKINCELYFTKHVNHENPDIWIWSTRKDVSFRGQKAITVESYEEIQKIIRGKAEIDIMFADQSNTGIPRIEGILSLDKAIDEESDRSEATDLSTSICTRLKKKINHLAKRGKLLLADDCSKKKEKSILDLGKGSFSAGCRKTSELLDIDTLIDQLVDTETMDHTLIATVPNSQSLRLIELFDVPQKIDLSAINIRLKKIALNCKAKTIDLHSTSLRRFTFIPGVLAVKNAALSLRVNFGNKNVIASMSGQWVIGSIHVNFYARYDTNDSSLLLRGTAEKGIKVDLKKELAALTGTNIPIPLPSVSLTNIAVTGQMEIMKGGLATVVVSGSIGRYRVHAVFQKPLKSGKFTGAFAADIGPIKLSNLIRKTTEVDISRVPFFGSLTIPRLGVTVSSEYITSSLLPKVFCKDGLLQNTAVIIPKKLQAFAVLNLRGIKTLIKISYYDFFLSFEVSKNGRLPIGTLLSTIPGVNIRSLPLPPGIKDIFRFQIDYFALDTNSKEMVVDTRFPGTLRYFKGYLTITKPALKVTAILKRPRKVDFEVDGAIKIGNGDYSITISRDPSSKKYVLKASFKTIPISDFLQKFSAKVLPRAFQKRLGRFIQFSIHNAKLTFPLGIRNLQLHLSGTPVIGGYKTVHMSAVIIRQGGKTKFIEGFQFGKVSLATLLNKITGKNMRGIAILNQELDTSLVISPVSLPGVHLYGSKLKDISIVKGVSIHATLQWPSNCVRDKFCAVAQKVLGKDAKLSLQASIQSTSSYTLSAGVSKVRLGGGVVLQRAALQIKAGAESSVGIYGEIHLSKIGITLSAGLRSGSRGVVLEGNMQGCWKRAFGSKWLSICNLHLLIAIQPTVTLVGALEIGGQVRIGNPSCVRHPLIALGYMGVDQLSPNNNFYYVQLKNKVTMGTLLQAFCIKFRLPRPLADSGFPKGFLSSFSPIGKELPKAGVSIPPGYRLKGTINILGLEAHADVTLSLPKGVNMNIALSPLKIGKGLLQMYASRSRKRGPFLKVIVESHPRRKVDIHASGFVSVLGIQVEAMLRITNTKYEYMVRGKFLHLFQASLHITANYGNIKKTGFRVRGYLKNDFFAVIRRKIQRALTSFSGKATKAIDNAMSKVNSKKAIFNRAIGKLNNAKHRVNKAKRVFDRAAHKMRQWQNKVNRLCRTRNCGRRRICYPCTERKCRRFWGKERCWHQPKKCCRHVTDPICRARNAACNVARRAAYHGLRVAQGIVQRSKGVLNVAKGALEAAKRVVDISKRPLDLANAFLRSVKNSLKAGLNAVSVVAKHGLGGVFDIRELKFDVALSSAATGHFRVSVLVSIFRKLKRFSLNINLKNLLSFVKAIGVKIFHRLKSFIR